MCVLGVLEFGPVPTVWYFMFLIWSLIFNDWDEHLVFKINSLSLMLNYWDELLVFTINSLFLMLNHWALFFSLHSKCHIPHFVPPRGTLVFTRKSRSNGKQLMYIYTSNNLLNFPIRPCVEFSVISNLYGR